MKTWKIILIVVLILVAVAAAIYYFGYYRKSDTQNEQENTSIVEEQSSATHENQRTATAPVILEPIDINQASIKVAFSDTQNAPVPTREALLNLLQSPLILGAIPFIHHTAGNNTCRGYIRYKNGYYRLASSKIDEQGYKVCYYKTIALQS